MEQDQRKRQLRKLLLKRLINSILQGKAEELPIPEGSLYNPLGSARREYYSPADRSGYNYGYMESSETGDTQLR